MYTAVNPCQDQNNGFDSFYPCIRDRTECIGMLKTNDIGYSASIICAVGGWGAWFAALDELEFYW